MREVSYRKPRNYGSKQQKFRNRLIALLAAIALVLYGLAGGFSSSESSTSASRPNAGNVADPNIFYTIVFDAGSSGSRIHVYQFTRKTGKLEMLYELFEQVKPGLSSYAADVNGKFKKIWRVSYKFSRCCQIDRRSPRAREELHSRRKLGRHSSRSQSHCRPPSPSRRPGECNY